MQIGEKHTVSRLVTQQVTAQAAGSGDLPVLATPWMAALMEQAAAELLGRQLPPEKTSVGVSLALEHLSATPVGAQVSAQAEVTACEGKSVRFSLQAWDDAGPVGRGEHTRVVVDRERFMQKAVGKLAGKP